MDSKEEILDKVYQLANKYEAERGSCPQCVTAAIYETFGVGDPKIIQAADALAGGSALSTEGTCGALVGGLLAIGAVVGRTYEDFSKGESKRRVFQYAKGTMIDLLKSTIHHDVKIFTRNSSDEHLT